jgi:hypothetical protein
MPTPIIPSYSPKSGDSLEVRMKSLENAFIDLTQQYLFLLKHLDSSNVKNVVTESTSIRSRHGETTIQGPLLIMKDKQGTPVVRLKMGYDKASTDFVYQLMNAAGDITVNIDSNGDLTVERGTFKGSITIGTGNNVIKANGTDGLWVGHADFVSAPFRVNLAGGVTATNLTVVGGTITGATIQTAATGERLVMDTNGVRAYNASGQLNGVAIQSSDSFGIYALFSAGVQVGFLSYDAEAGVGLYSMNGKPMVIGSNDNLYIHPGSGKTVYPSGTWDFNGTTISNLGGYALESWVTSGFSASGHNHSGTYATPADVAYAIDQHEIAMHGGGGG